MCGKPELADDHLGLYVGIFDEADDADDATRRPVTLTGKACDLDLDDLVLVFGGIVDHEDLRRKLLVAGRNEEDFAIETQLSNDRVTGPLRYGDHSALGAASRFAKGDLRLDGIAVHCRTGERGGNENVAVDPFDGLLRNDKAISIAMQHDRPFNDRPQGSRFEP